MSLGDWCTMPWCCVRLCRGEAPGDTMHLLTWGASTPTLVHPPTPVRPLLGHRLAQEHQCWHQVAQ